jgi:hypothetical protein
LPPMCDNWPVGIETFKRQRGQKHKRIEICDNGVKAKERPYGDHASR